MEPRYKVIMISMGGTEIDTGVEGTYAECEDWCNAMGWEACPDGGFVWDLEIEEI